MIPLPYPRPSGPGTINRKDVPGVVIQAEILTPFNQPGAVGVPGVGVVIDSTTGWLRCVRPTDIRIDGLLCANFPMLPRDGGIVSLMKRGYMNVRLMGQAPARAGAPVWCRIASAFGRLLGGLEAAEDGGNCILLPNSTFTGPADAEGLVEVAYRI